ncbi:hypothetical protein PENTCL1PPCAC_28019, partial [Pristionchus entomophagus]
MGQRSFCLKMWEQLRSLQQMPRSPASLTPACSCSMVVNLSEARSSLVEKSSLPATHSLNTWGLRSRTSRQWLFPHRQRRTETR